MKNDAAAFQRIIGPLADIPAQVAAMGGDSSKVFDGSNVVASDLTIGNLVPYAEILKLLVNAAEITRCPHFGLLLGQNYDHTSLGVLGTLIANAPTLGEAFQDYVNLQIGQSRAAAVYSYQRDDTYFLGYGIYEPNNSGSWHAYDLAIAMASNMVANLSGGEAAPDEILISHRAPQDRRPYEQILEVPPRFNQIHTGISLSDAAIRCRVQGASPQLRRQALEQLTNIAEFTLADAAPRVRHFVRAAICRGDVTMSAIGRHLGIHVKTLERRLEGEGTSFEKIRDEVRFAVSRELLDLTDLPISDIADALSYATHSAYDHAFKRWSNMAPTEWRSRNARNS